MTALERAINSALDANGTMGGFFDRIGTSKNRGFVIVTYEMIARELDRALRFGDLEAVNSALQLMDVTLGKQVLDFLQEASDAGVEEAKYQLDLYQIKGAEGVNLSEQVNSAAYAVLSRVKAQGDLIRAMVLTGAESEQILGTEDAPGVLRWSDITRQLAYFTAAMFWGAFSVEIDITLPAGQTLFRKQAVAVLDNRTTDCCKQVNGQVQNLNDPFVLTGEPRFADKMDWPGFHWHCRTGVALVG